MNSIRLQFETSAVDFHLVISTIISASEHVNGRGGLLNFLLLYNSSSGAGVYSAARWAL